MQKITSHAPEVINYGRCKYEEGYAVGYDKANTDRRVRVMSKKRFVTSRFLNFRHFLEVLKD
jgi:hypothetical protein